MDADLEGLAEQRPSGGGPDMIDPAALTSDAAGAQKRLGADIAARAKQVPELHSFLTTEYQGARDAERTQLSESQFFAQEIDQAASSWVLSICLVRFLEDTGLITEPVISGPADRDQRARDALTLHFRAHPEHEEREYLEHAFRGLADLPGLHDLFGPKHTLLYALGPSSDGARELIEFFRRRDPETGQLLHDFTDPDRGTRFLGDLYQDLSALARKRYALLQTPDFIEAFILDRTLEPAVKEFGLSEASLIDPACGSGHFLLGAFDRLFAHWQNTEPHTEPRLLAQRALDQIAGVDLNPVAIAIARFRLLVAALSKAKSRTLREAPDFHVHLAAADSLLHGPRPGQIPGAEGHPARNHHYRAEEVEAAARILGRSYTCVVGNPPYITPNDPAEKAAYRARYGSCNGKYSLAVPFIERFFDLASTDRRPGYVGMITANSFMKREFGTKLIKEFLPKWDLTHVIDTSGADIPGHGTPTVILLARNRRPVGATVRCVLGVRGEPSPPEDPAKGLVWSAIEAQVDQPGSESDFVSVVDLARERLASHPWSLGGGGAAELKVTIERGSTMDVRQIADHIGITSVTGEDDLYVLPNVETCRRLQLETVIPLVLGDGVRDWDLTEPPTAVWLYDDALQVRDLEETPIIARYLWVAKTSISKRKRFGTPMLDRGLTWFEWQELYVEKLRTPLTITFAFVATHNHFVLDRGGKVFKQTAPVIKLPAGATEDDHLALLGPLNSSAGCFWMKQVFFDRRIADQAWDRFYEHDSTKLARFPLPADLPTDLARTLDSLAQEASHNTPASLCERETPTRESLNAAKVTWQSTRQRMIAAQEELDWRCYRLYAITDSELTYPAAPPEVAFGERAFEIVLARKVAQGDVDTAWFTRHRAEPVTEVPARWPADYCQLIEQRIALIESSKDIGLIERPEYKRRWAHEPWEVQEQKALRLWLLDRMESPSVWDSEPAELQSIARLSDRMRADPEFLSVLSLYLGHPDYDLTKAVGDLAKDESVPYLAALRYNEPGMTKRAEWEEVWDLQRQEDAIDARSELPEDDPAYLSPARAKETKEREVGTITPPPRYAKTDFRSGSFWTLRGKLDVPKERFISYLGAEREADPTAVIGWAGWDHRQRAIALAFYIGRAQDQEGWSQERLMPLLAGLAELIPWLMQWHNEPDAQGTRFDTFAATLLADRTRRAGLGAQALGAWRPAPTGRGRPRERIKS